MTPRSRTRLRLVLRDLSATAAFGSIVLSGAVPTWALAAYALALLTSLLGRRPLALRPTLSVVLLLLTAVLLFGAAFRGLLDLVVAACTFAGLVTSHRLLSEPTSGTDQQVQLTSLLMLAGGAALTGELWYGACLTAFALTSSLSLGLSVIEPPGGSDEGVSVRPLLARIGVGTLVALAGAASFFVLFPRLSWNIAARRVAPGLGGTSGMSDSVRLTGTGDIKSSPRVVARVRMTPDPQVDRLDAYFPGRSFDAFDGQQWKGTGKPSAPRASINGTQRPPRGAVNQSVELLVGYDARTLVALDRPLAFSNAIAMGTSGSSRTNLIEVPNEEVHFAGAANGYTYSATSAPPDQLETEPLLDAARFTQLPAQLDPRVAQLAQRILGNERRPLPAAELLRRHLQREYGYTLELSGQVDDPLADFLFARKAGHCEHFATALTVLLRTQGIAARVTAGFFGGERIGDRYVLRAGDAHAWTQVFVANRGWVTVDATPDAGRTSQPSRLWAWLVDAYERVESLWRSRVIDYSFSDQIDLARALVRPPRGSTSRAALPALPPARALVAATVAAVLVYFLLSRWRGFRGPRRSHAATGFLQQIEAALARQRIARLPGEGIEELSARLSHGTHPIAPALRLATRAYLKARFGGATLSHAERAALVRALERRRDASRSPAPAAVE